MGACMATPLGWARCLDNVADVLRRGAWYPIVDDSDDDKVVLEVRKKPVRVSRIDVTLRDTPSALATSLGRAPSGPPRSTAAITAWARCDSPKLL